MSSLLFTQQLNLSRGRLPLPDHAAAGNTGDHGHEHGEKKWVLPHRSQECCCSTLRQSSQLSACVGVIRSDMESKAACAQLLIVQQVIPSASEDGSRPESLILSAFTRDDRLFAMEFAPRSSRCHNFFEL